MKKILLIAVLALLLGGCGKNLEDKLIGTWDVTTNKGDAGTMVIKENNTLIAKYGMFEDAYSYKIDNDKKKIEVQRTKEGSEPIIYNIEEGKNSFIFSNDDEEMTLTK